MSEKTNFLLLAGENEVSTNLWLISPTWIIFLPDFSSQMNGLNGAKNGVEEKLSPERNQVFVWYKNMKKKETSEQV